MYKTTKLVHMQASINQSINQSISEFL